jgi:hypothetical protein
MCTFSEAALAFEFVLFIVELTSVLRICVVVDSTTLMPSGNFMYYLHCSSGF